MKKRECGHVSNIPLALVIIDTRSTLCCGAVSSPGFGPLGGLGFLFRAALVSNTRARRSTISAARAGSTALSPLQLNTWWMMSRMYTHCRIEEPMLTVITHTKLYLHLRLMCDVLQETCGVPEIPRRTTSNRRPVHCQGEERIRSHKAALAASRLQLM